MRKNLFLTFLFLAVYTINLVAQQPSTGTLEHHPAYPSNFVKSRDVWVWLPDGYTPTKKYAVLYMHDGQMLFDAETTWNKQEWKVDEVSGNLIGAGMTKEYIVVGIANLPEERFYNYFPQKSLNYLAPNEPLFEKEADKEAPLVETRFNADSYLQFIVKELKPFIDKKYATRSDREHTYVAGSSMGGLISLYALCEYPNVFGGCAAISMHSPMVNGGNRNDENSLRWAAAFRKYLDASLPKANSRKIYIDYGDQTLDAFYKPYQDQIDALLRTKGWNSSAWVTKFFPGTAHTETDWAKRLGTPIQYLLASQKQARIEKVEPEFWWSGMVTNELQIMVTGSGIGYYDATVKGNGVTLKEAVTLDSPNYLVLYLDVKEAAAGSFTIDFQRGNHKLSHTYPLKQRKEGARERNGFNSSDVVYLLMPDRFVNGNPQNDLAPVKHPDKLDRTNISTRHGGDIAGVKSKADYLADLGVTALWMTPVFENDMANMSYHGYSITDYYRVDPRLGSNQEYADMVAELQSKGIKTIKDMVFNHCGGNHPWVKDTPALDWFNSTDGYVQTNHNKNIFFDPYAAAIDHKLMTDGWFVTSMPDLNQRNPHLAKYLIQNSIWWIEYAGLNGIRQDTYPYPDREMMAEWCRRVNEEYPNFPIVGEIMVGNPVTTAFWQANSKLNPTNTHLKCVMDFTLSSIAHAAFTEETGWDTGLQKIHNYLSYDFCYPDINNVMRLLENHDMCRFYKEQPADTKSMKQALTLLLTLPGIPQLYYGQEFLFTGSSKVDYGYIRPDMPGGWEGDVTNLFEPSGRTAVQQEMFDFMKRMLNWRKGNDIIAQGSMKHFQLREGVYVYERSLNGKNVIVIMNGVSKEVQLPLADYAEILTHTNAYRDVLTSEAVALEGSTLTVPARGVYVLEELVK